MCGPDDFRMRQVARSRRGDAQLETDLRRAFGQNDHAVGELSGFFNVVRVHNAGAAFSFLASASGWQRWFFTAIGIAAALLIVWLLRSHAGQKLFSFSLACILGGAVGNVIDRSLHGYVVDFLDFHYRGWHFPAFNIADSAITIGAICLVLDELRRVRRS